MRKRYWTEKGFELTSGSRPIGIALVVKHASIEETVEAVRRLNAALARYHIALEGRGSEPNYRTTGRGENE
ncbi:MAG: hypothetical protein KKD18_03960 [Nanoarchaeota archaeon]|nr:hypothetical protein [Nanoarchaeota archaeon]MBU0977547.1 hypothetical protein [Nanoarchaeota archaeon]